MSITINTNMSSILTQRSLEKSTNSLNLAMQRMSTGYKINSSKDDAAGLAISNNMGYQTSSYKVAQSNTQMGQSLLDTADGTLDNINSMLVRIRELTEQAANGTYGDDERKAMQTEVDCLTEEIYRVKNSTEFNGKNIFGKETYTPTPTPTPTHPTTEEEAIAQGYTVVKSAQQLKDSLTTDAKVMLFANIDLDDLGFDSTGSNWTPVETFSGILDGNGYTISNLTIKKEDYNQSLIETCNGTVKNLNLKDVDINAKTGAAICGRLNNGGTIENCSVSGTVSTTSSYGNVGGIAIANFGAIKNCSFSGTVSTTSSYSNAGGIAFTNFSGGKIENCSVSGTVSTTSSSSNAGGIVATNNSTIENCSVSSTVSTTSSSNAGGIVASNTSTIKNCSFSGTAKGNYAGGIVANNTSTIENCSSSGTAKGNYAGGGITGYNSGTIKNCSSSGTVNGSSNAGGITGYNTKTIENSRTTAIVSGSSSNTGAVIGKYSGGTLSGNSYDAAKNPDLKAVGSGLDNPKEEQIKNESTVINLQVGIYNDDDSIIKVDTGFELGSFSVSLATDTSARNALTTIDAMIQTVTDKRTEIGATSNRLDSVLNVQDAMVTNLTACTSLIKDADIAEESSNYIKSQILQQTTATLLYTANQNPSIALTLV